MKHWNTLATGQSFHSAKVALEQNGFTVFIVQTGEDAKAKALSLIPVGAEIMGMSSTTLDTLSITQELQEEGKYVSVRSKLMSMDRATQGRDMQRLGATPEWAIGSVHAVTEDGKILIASNSGSQLPAYAYGSDHVIWIVGGQKIVKNLDEGIKRIYEHSLPLESERAKKAYGVPGSFVSKILIFSREIKEKRITIILVKEVLGF